MRRELALDALRAALDEVTGSADRAAHGFPSAKRMLWSVIQEGPLAPMATLRP